MKKLSHKCAVKSCKITICMSMNLAVCKYAAYRVKMLEHKQTVSAECVAFTTGVDH